MPNDAISIEIDDSDVRRLLNRLPGGLERALRGALNDASALVLRDLTTYPPERPGQTYVRTRTLGRSWSREFQGSGLELRAIVGSNENMAPYNREVQDEAEQATVHQGRWPTVQGVQRARERQIQEMFEARVRDELG